MSVTVLSELVGAAAAPMARARMMEENFIFELRGWLGRLEYGYSSFIQGLMILLYGGFQSRLCLLILRTAQRFWSALDL